MRKSASILVALAACVVLAGVAAAESPDAGDTWSTAKGFSISNGYNWIDGQLTETNPTDQIDVWKSGDPSAGSYLELFLDGTSYSNYVKAQMYDDDKDLMQQVYRGGGGPSSPDFTLDSSPVYAKITGNLEDRAYTFGVYKN